MASRAHVIHDQSLGNYPVQRQRRAVWLHRDEEVVLPRSRDTSGAGALLISALIASALTAGLAYAVYVGDAPTLAVTEAAPLTSSWEPDTSFLRASVTNQLSGPALSAVSKEAPMIMPEAGMADVPAESESAAQGSSSALTSADDEWSPRTQPAPIEEQQPSEPQLGSSVPDDGAAPYPNPSTTPPDGFAPPRTQPQAPPPADPENPYDF